MAALISGHPVQKSIAIHFHPCDPVIRFQNTCSILLCLIVLSNLFVYLVAFGNVMWKLEKIAISMISRDSVNDVLNKSEQAFQPYSHSSQERYNPWVLPYLGFKAMLLQLLGVSIRRGLIEHVWH